MRETSAPIRFRIGVLQLSMEPLRQTVRMAQACERAGFDIFWLAEAYPWWRKHGMEARSSTAMTAVIATQTKDIIIGWGIISPYTRHPVQIAMDAAHDDRAQIERGRFPARLPGALFHVAARIAHEVRSGDARS